MTEETADQAERNRKVVLRLFALSLDGDPEGALELVAADYVEHSPVIAAGKEGLAVFLRELTGRPTAPRVTVHRVVADDEHVVVHYDSADGPDDRGRAVADIFRLRDGLIVEHWDVVQSVPADNPQSGDDRGA